MSIREELRATVADEQETIDIRERASARELVAQPTTPEPGAARG